MTIVYPRILLIDSYDSFTFNLASLCRKSIPNCSIHIIRNDDMSIAQILPHLNKFSAVIVGPGPGSPDVPSDIGFIRDLWKVAESDLVPVFGVCLGLQSLGVEFGARLRRLNVVKHGQVSKIIHNGTGLFQGVGEVNAVRYHSLHVELDEAFPCDLEKIAWTDDGEENGQVVMAIRHKARPFWAVQYHPESVCTDGGGPEVLRNFWNMAQEWINDHGRSTVQHWDAQAHSLFGFPWPHLNLHTPPPSTSENGARVTTSEVQLPSFDVAAVCERLGVQNEEKPFVLLDSAADPGRFTIIGALDSSSVRISYNAGDNFVRVAQGDTVNEEPLGKRKIWSWLATFMRMRKAQGNPKIPFWGGLVGHITYELGVDSLGVPFHRGQPATSHHSDINFVFVDRSVVYDQLDKVAYVQSLLPNDESWVNNTTQWLREGSYTSSPPPNEASSTTADITSPIITMPDKDKYIARIKECKERLFAGDSYELCLTARTRISVQNPFPHRPKSMSSSWTRYKHLRKANPAPHSAYIRLHPTTLLSSSPERFLSYSRPPGSICQLRPIKGTVRKGPGVTRQVAVERLVGSVKEVAENLMIVDLIRHDLHSVVGDHVDVKKFCGVEEYETVWQLTSVIEGKLSDNMEATGDEVGWEVLQKSLPPGSMTGAPKKRSVEILQGLEDDERGIYSGVFGYWDVGGGGDWSVTIRSCYKYDDRSITPYGSGGSDISQEEWVLGAGGAITALSDPEAEWEEMVVKLEGVLRSFGLSPF